MLLPDGWHIFISPSFEPVKVPLQVIFGLWTPLCFCDSLSLSRPFECQWCSFSLSPSQIHICQSLLKVWWSCSTDVQVGQTGSGTLGNQIDCDDASTNIIYLTKSPLKGIDTSRYAHITICEYGEYKKKVWTMVNNWYVARRKISMDDDCFYYFNQK